MGRRIEARGLSRINSDTHVAIAGSVAWPVSDCGVKSGWVRRTKRIVKDIGVQVHLASGEPDRVLADKALMGRAVVPRPVVVEAGAVVFPARVLVGIRVVLARGRARSEGFIRVGGLNDAGIVGQGQSRAQGIAQERAGARAPTASKELIEAEAGKQIGHDVAGPVQLLHGIVAVVVEAGGGVADDLPRAPPE